MAGASMGDDEENPCAVNVVPLIDVIFCLCVFFFCVFQFKTIEGRIDAWLPKDKGHSSGQVDISTLAQEMRVELEWDAASKRCKRGIAGEGRSEMSDGELADKIKSKYDTTCKVATKPEDVAVKIDDVTANPAESVPWQEVITVMDLIKRIGIQAGKDIKIEFAAPMGYKVRELKQ